MTATEAIESQGDPARVYRSGLDDRVWVPTIPGQAVADSECMSSTSLRRVKAYVEECMPEGGTWTKHVDGNGKSAWEYLAPGWWEGR